MNTLILYATTHGCTEKYAMLMKQGIAGNVTVLNLKDKKARNPDYKDFQNVIIGGSIHAGRLQKSVKDFMKRHSSQLLRMKLGLFLSCMEEGDTASKQFEDNFPEEIRDHASATGIFGGEFDFKKMNFLEKAIVKKVAGIKKSVSRMDEDAVQNFIDEFQR
jgi:menaquinone-dependent protoporphyrinogen oxidase